MEGRRTRGRTRPSAPARNRSASLAHDGRRRRRAPSRLRSIAATARRVAFDEHRARRAARERLDPERARAGVEVEHARARRRRRASRRAPRARGRRSGACARRAAPRSRRPLNSPATTLTPLAHAGIGSSSEPKRATTASRSSACSGCLEAAGRPAGSRPRGRARARAARRPRAAARRGTRAARAGACRARRRRRAARGRSRRAGSRRARRRSPRARGSLGSPNRMQSDSCSPRPTRPRSWCSCDRP